MRKIVFLFIVILLLSSACSGNPKAPADAASQILGIAKNETSPGVVEVQFYDALETIPSRMNITINHDLTGVIKLSEEIGTRYAMKIKSMYDKIPELDEVIFLINLPYNDGSGNIIWRKDIQFTFRRKIFERVNWDNSEFVKLHFLDLAESVKMPK